MEPEAKYTVVGVAVLLLLALLAGTVVWLRSSGEGAQAQRYTIRFERQSLDGLEARSDVTMRGMRVGSVTGFRFAANRPGVVEVFIALNPSTPVQEGTQASIRRNLITGLASVQLVNAAQPGPRLPSTPGGADGPLIAEGESTEQQVANTLGELVQRLNATLSPENQAAFSDILANLRRVSEHADRSLARVDATLDTVGGTARDVQALAKAVSADARVLTARYGELGQQASATARDAGETMRRLGVDIERLTRRADALLSSGDGELRSTAQVLRNAAESIGTAADRLREPGEILYGPAEGSLGPGEGRR